MHPLIRTLLAGLGTAALFTGPVMTSSVHAATAPQWPCSLIRCTQVTNGGSRALGIVYGTGAGSDVQACYDGKRDWCKASVLYQGQTTYSKWDADAVGVPKGCKLQFFKYDTKGGHYEDYYGQKTYGTKTWYKVSGDIKVRAVC